VLQRQDQGNARQNSKIMDHDSIMMMMMMMMVVVNTLTISVHSKRTYDGKDSTVPIECQQSFSPSKY
jgi:hypothetical protein